MVIKIGKIQEDLIKMNNLQKEQTTNERFIKLYLSFKSKCLNQGINDINEIIKLFGAWVKICS